MRKNHAKSRKKHFEVKSYRKKYKYYYTLTFLIPIMVILIANTFTQNTIKQQVIQSNQKTLTQFFRLLDENMEIMLGDAVTLVMRQELVDYAKLNTKQTVVAHSQKVQILDLLDDYCVSHGYEDIFVWFPYSDRILSGVNAITSSINLQKYSEAYYGKSPQIRGELEKLRTHEAIKPVIWPIVSEDGERSFAISVNRFGGDSTLPNYTVNLIVNNEFLDSPIKDGILSQHENAMFFNKDGELLFSYQKEELSSLPEQYRDSGIYEMKENGASLTLLVHRSECTDGFYAMALSHEDFYKPLTRIRLVSFFGILLSILVGVFVVYRMSLNTYRPLELILAQLQDNVDQAFDPKQQSEFEYFVDFIDGQKKKRNAEIIQKQKVANAERRKNLLMASLEGAEINDQDQDFLEQQISDAEYFYGGILQLNDCGELGWKLASFAVGNVFSELLGAHYQCDILSVSPTRYVFILGSETEKPEELLTMALHSGMGFLRENLKIGSSFGLADCWRNLGGLRKMYRQAQQALEYKFILPHDSVIRYRDIRERQRKATYFDGNTLFRVMKDFLQKGDLTETAVQDFLNRLLKQYEIDEHSAIESVDYFRYEMLNALNRVWTGKNLESFKRQKYVDTLIEVKNIEQYQLNLVRILCETGTDMRENSHRMILADKMKKYIEANFSDPNLNVMMIGDAFGMQGAYLSQVFREEYGMFLPNYISHTRVKQAKKLLRETNDTIVEISKATGFLSSSVFIKTFKKLVGITPGKYKEAEIENNKF